MSAIKLSPLLILALMVMMTRAVVYLRVLDVVPSSGASASPIVSFILDGTQLNANPVQYNHYQGGFGITPERLYYYPTTAGDHQLVVANYNNNSIVYVNTTVTGLVDGKYYSTLAGNPTVLTLEDDNGTQVPAGFAWVRFVDSWTGAGTNSLTLRINGVNNANFSDGQVANGGYIELDITQAYNFTVSLTSNLPVTFFDHRVQNFTNGAFTYWLIGPYSSGGNYNGSSGSYSQGRLVDGAAADVFAATTTPAVTTTSAATTTQSGTTTTPGTTTTVPGTTTTQPSGTTPQSTTTAPATTQSTAVGSAFLSAAIALTAAAFLLA